MKFVTIRKENGNALGVAVDAGIIDLSAALQVYPKAGVPTDVMELLQADEQAAVAAREAVVAYVDELLHTSGNSEESSTAEASGYLLHPDEVGYGPVVTKPGKIICVGLNYRKHAEETNAPIPNYPILFNKFSNTLAGHGEEIPLPQRVSSDVDYEAELTIVIGKRAKYVAKEQALDYVFGYTCVNDLSARDLQRRTPQWMLGKCCDKFSPLGPWLVTADEVGNPNALHISATVNGTVRQQSNTSDMIFPCDEIVSYVSQHMTLEPGDIILTGTPEGVVLGLPPEQRVYLQPGDEVTIEIEKLGKLTNRMVAEEI